MAAISIINMNRMNRRGVEQLIEDELAIPMYEKTDYDRECECEVVCVIDDPSDLPPIKWVSHDKKWRWLRRYTHNEDWDLQKLLKFGQSYRQSIVYKNGYTAHFDRIITSDDRLCVTKALYAVIQYARTLDPCWKESFYSAMKDLFQHYPGTKALIRRVKDYFALLY